MSILNCLFEVVIPFKKHLLYVSVCESVLDFNLIEYPMIFSKIPFKQSGYTRKGKS
jgi:hypothetical protein